MGWLELRLTSLKFKEFSRSILLNMLLALHNLLAKQLVE